MRLRHTRLNKRCQFVVGFAMLVGVGFSPLGLAAELDDLQRIAANYFDQDFLSKAADYHKARLLLFFIQTGLILSALGVLVAGPLSAWGRKALSFAKGRAWLGRVLVISVIYLALAFVRLPFSIVRYFHAHQYELRYDTLSTYLLDWSKGLGTGWFMIVVVGLIGLSLFATLPRWWWLASGIVISTLAIVSAIAAPIVIDPMYYQLSRLEDSALEKRVLDICTAAGVNADEILIADASRRSGTVNAYFTGFGETQRIILFDTLLKKFSEDEVAIVVAHEAGHWQQKHIQKGLLMGIPAVLLGLFIVHLILNWCIRNRFGGLSSRSDPALAIPAYSIYILLMYVALVPSNWISRQMEAQADQISLEITQDPGTFIRTRVRISKENLSDVLPPTWVENTLYTHPSNARRILMAEKFGRLNK